MSTASTGGRDGTRRAPSPARSLRLRARLVPAVVAACALLAALARIPAIGWSPGPDESGFTLVARAWHPSPDSPYAPYWVDRPPLLIALFRATDAVGGVHGIRWVAVVGCALLVLASAGVAGEVSRSGAAGTSDRTVVLTVLGTTALVSNPAIDLVFAKGEILSLPLLVGSAWLVLRARRSGSVPASVAAGLLAGTALGLKQNLVGALVFAAVLLVGGRLRGTLSTSALLRLGGAFLAGAMTPVAAMVGWAVVQGVHLAALDYAVLGFRADAFDVITAGHLDAPLRRAGTLVKVGATSGLALLLLWFVLSLRRLARERLVLTLATLTVLLVDVTALALGGSYWRPYLFGLVPSAVLALALLASSPPPGAPGAGRTRPARSRLVTGAVVAVLVAACAVSAVRWVPTWPRAELPSTKVLVGHAVAAASRPGDTLTVWAGQADLQLASGMASPYEHLWSLPARTRDPRSEQLAAVLGGANAPTWFLTWAGLDAWGGRAQATVGPVVRSRYVRVGTVCGGHALYRLRDEPRPAPAVGCRALRAARAAADQT